MPCVFSYMLHKNAPDCSDRKTGKWSKVREKVVPVCFCLAYSTNIQYAKTQVYVEILSV